MFWVVSLDLRSGLRWAWVVLVDGVYNLLAVWRGLSVDAKRARVGKDNEGKGVYLPIYARENNNGELVWPSSCQVLA
ncbi:hypothetical protein K440DRAFT_625616 [Wilcoxina mikolae CBS 423.85]|nr:hypothetical protein K440DRAFT_625616 [Wilcoxina mikolae CBS 423.85]